MDDQVIATATDTLRLERLLPGPIERVWAYLTESDKRATWLAAGDMTLVPGAPLALTFRNGSLTKDDDPAPPEHAVHDQDHGMTGRILACEPPTRLSFAWDGVGQVTFELSPVGRDVRLVVTHERLDRREVRLNVSTGWHTHVGILADRLAGREPPGFWRTFKRLKAEYDRTLPPG